MIKTLKEDEISDIVIYSDNVNSFEFIKTFQFIYISKKVIFLYLLKKDRKKWVHKLNNSSLQIFPRKTAYSHSHHEHHIKHVRLIPKYPANKNSITKPSPYRNSAQENRSSIE